MQERLQNSPTLQVGSSSISIIIVQLVRYRTAYFLHVSTLGTDFGGVTTGQVAVVSKPTDPEIAFLVSAGQSFIQGQNLRVHSQTLAGTTLDHALVSVPALHPYCVYSLSLFLLRLRFLLSFYYLL